MGGAITRREDALLDVIEGVVEFGFQEAVAVAQDVLERRPPQQM